MPSTHLSLHVHVVFSTKDREPWFDRPFRPKLYHYLGGVLLGLGAHPREIGGVADHVHLLFDPTATESVSYLVQEVKKASSTWIQAELRKSSFRWQEGYGAFTVGPTTVDAVGTYIRHQEQHHKEVSFVQEYTRLLVKAGVPFEPKYLW